MSTADTPSPDSPWPAAPPGAPGLKVGFPGAHELASQAHRFSHRTMIALLAAGLGVLTLTLIVVALLATPGPPAYCPPLKCQGPPTGQPRNGVTGQNSAGPAVVSGTAYTSPAGFSLRYFPQPTVQTTTSGIGLTYAFNSGTASLDVFGGPAGQTTPQAVVQSFMSQNFPSAQAVYQMPEPLVGYHPGFGEAFNVQPASSDGSTQTARVLVIAATYNGFAVVVVAYGSLLPPVTAKSTFFNGHPSPANLNLAYFGGADALVNSIVFP